MRFVQISFKYEGDDEKVFPVTEAGGWKAAEKTDLIGTWKVCLYIIIIYIKI